MSSSICELQENPIVSLYNQGMLRFLSLSAFCGPRDILTFGTEDTPVCVQIAIDSSVNFATIRLTKTQALKLAEEIQNVYREMLRPEDSD